MSAKEDKHKVCMLQWKTGIIPEAVLIINPNVPGNNG